MSLTRCHIQCKPRSVSRQPPDLWDLILGLPVLLCWTLAVGVQGTPLHTLQRWEGLSYPPGLLPPVSVWAQHSHLWTLVLLAMFDLVRWLCGRQAPGGCCLLALCYLGDLGPHPQPLALPEPVWAPQASSGHSWGAGPYFLVLVCHWSVWPTLAFGHPAGIGCAGSHVPTSFPGSSIHQRGLSSKCLAQLPSK